MAKYLRVICLEDLLIEAEVDAKTADMFVLGLVQYVSISNPTNFRPKTSMADLTVIRKK